MLRPSPLWQPLQACLHLQFLFHICSAVLQGTPLVCSGCISISRYLRDTCQGSAFPWQASPMHTCDTQFIPSRHASSLSLISMRLAGYQSHHVLIYVHSLCAAQTRSDPTLTRSPAPLGRAGSLVALALLYASYSRSTALFKWRGCEPTCSHPRTSACGSTL